MLDSDSATAKINDLIRIGASLLEKVDYDKYDRWNDGTLTILELIFGQSSEPYMSFRFPAGAEPADSRESRVKNAISQKVKVLNFVHSDLSDHSIKPKLGWTQSEGIIDQAISDLENS